MLPSLRLYAACMTDSSTEAHRYPNPRYAWYVVVLLTLAYILSYLDRQVGEGNDNSQSAHNLTHGADCFPVHL